jgi:protease IV
VSAGPPPGYHPPMTPAPRRKGGSGWWWVVAIGLVVALGLSVMFNFILLVAIAGIESGATSEFIESTESGKGSDKLLHVRVDGVIAAGKSEFGQGSGDETIIGMLESARDEESIKGVILDVNSPGGEVTASDKIAAKVRELRGKGKKVYVLMGDLCASGGYYVSAYADRIYAHPTTITGSIGVIIHSVNVQELLRKVGVAEVIYKSGNLKDILSPTRAPTDEEKKLLQGLVDQMFQRFVNVVSQGRNIDVATVKGFADGRVWTAQEAVDLHLVDEIGYFDDVVTALKKELKLSEATVITYKKPFSLSEFAENKLNSGEPLATAVSRLTTPRLLYMWAPALP